MSTTRFVRNDAPIVECIDRAKLFLTYLCTSDVLPTPCEPNTTILASKLLLMFVVLRRRKSLIVYAVVASSGYARYSAK